MIIRGSGWGSKCHDHDSHWLLLYVWIDGEEGIFVVHVVLIYFQYQHPYHGLRTVSSVGNFGRGCHKGRII